MSINKAILVGNVGQDPEVKTFDGGGKVANFSLATTERYKNKSGETVTNTEWHKISVFGRFSDIVEQYVKKGSQLYVEGKIKTRSWENKDGVKQYTTEIIADSIKMIGSKPSQSNTASGDSQPEPPVDDRDDLPF